MIITQHSYYTYFLEDCNNNYLEFFANNYLEFFATL